MFVLLAAGALAAPNHALGISADAANIDFGTTVAWRAGWASGMQLGVRARGAAVSTSFIDGYPVSRGSDLTGTVGIALPLARTSFASVDLEIDTGVQHVIAAQTTGPHDRATSLVFDLSPVVTVPVADGAALRLGWTQVFREQLTPSVTLKAQGSLAQVGAVVAIADGLQWTVRGTTGGLYGFDGDGGKFLARVETGLRWAPGTARTWTNH